MKTKYFFMASAILLATMLCISPAWCEPPVEDDQGVSYENYVDEQIQHNEFKSTLGSAKTPNLQKNAEISREKAEFLRNNRDALISEMKVNNVEMKPYKMHRYLNQTFFDSYHPGGGLYGESAIEAYEE